MALQTTGPISLGNVSVELGRPTNETRNLGSATTRALLGVPSGIISLSTARGKSNLTPMTTFSQNIAATNSYRVVSGKTYIGPWGGYPAHGGRAGVTVSINGGADVTLGTAAWQPFVYTVANTNGRPQIVNFLANWSCGVWDSSTISLYRTSPQVYVGGMSSGHVPDWSIYNFNFSVNTTVPANTTYTYQFYQNWDVNGDYIYNNHASTLNSVTITHVGWV